MTKKLYKYYNIKYDNKKCAGAFTFIAYVDQCRTTGDTWNMAQFHSCNERFDV